MNECNAMNFGSYVVNVNDALLRIFCRDEACVLDVDHDWSLAWRLMMGT